MKKSVMNKSSKNQRFLLVRPNLAKRGQFYLVAAVVLAALIMSISAISNYSKKERNPRLDELTEEIQIESAKTMDYGTNNRLNSAQMNQLMQNFTNYYINYEARNGKNLYFVFGNSNNITVSGYQETAKVVSVASGSSQTTITQSGGNFTGSIIPSGNALVLSIDGKQHNFNLSTAENFYFVITRDVSGGEYVVTG
mgnify:CR=1 FL=1